MKNPSFWSVCILLAHLAAGCSVETNPELPTWEAEFNLPLGTKTTTLGEWVDESDDLSENASGLVAFHFQGTLDRAQVGDRLKVDPVEESFHQSMGPFELHHPTPQASEFLFCDLWPPSVALDGQTVPIPGFQFQEVGITLPEFDRFESATFEEGSLTVVLRNLLPVGLEDISIEIVDGGTSDVVMTLPFPDVPPGSTDSTIADLAGMTLTNRLVARASGGSPGSGAEPEFIDAGVGVEVEVTLTDLTATAATADLPATEIMMAETAEIPGGIVVTEAEICHGSIHLHLANDLPVTLVGTLSVEEFRDPAGSRFTTTVNLPAGGESVEEIGLEGYTLEPVAPEAGHPQLLNVAAEVTTEETAGPVTVTALDGISVDVGVDTLAFSRVSGILDSTTFEVEPSAVELDFPDDLESISLEEAVLTLQLTSTIPVPMSLSLEALGESEDGKTISIPIEADLLGGQGAPAYTTTVVLDQENSLIVDLLNHLPRTISLSGEARIGDGITEGEVSQEDYVEGTYEFEVPFYLAIEEQTVETELTEVEILPEEGDVDGGDNAVDGELTSRMKSAELWVTFHNHTPFGMVATLYAAADSPRVFTDPDLALEPVELAPGVVDETGAVVEAAARDNHLTLTDEELGLFRNSGDAVKLVYLGSTLRLLSTDGQAVKVRCSDYVQTEARIRVAATVGGFEDD